MDIEDFDAIEWLISNPSPLHGLLEIWVGEEVLDHLLRLYKEITHLAGDLRSVRCYCE